MKRFSFRAIINVVQGFFVLLPLIITSVIFFTISTTDFSIAKTSLVITMVLSIIAVVIQNLIIGRFIGAFEKMIEKLKKVEKGDLTIVPREKGIQEISELSDTIERIVNEFHEMVSNVYMSTSEVNHLIGTVVDVSNEAARSSNDISKSSEAVAEGAIKQAEDSESSYNMSMEMVQRIEVVADSTDLMLEKAKVVRNMTDFGKESVSDLLDKSKITENNITKINMSVEALSSMASDITTITDIITNIANQTNLLSLNASIEAARAGEAGKGFGVVANEIKKLAQKSLESVQNIVNTVEGVQTQVKETTEKINSTNQNIISQINAVHKTNEAFTDIAGAAMDLFTQLGTVRDGISQLDSYKSNIAISIESISAVASETAASSEEITSLMYTQSNSAEVLVELSNNLKKMVSGLDSQLNKYNFRKEEKVRKTFAIIPVLDIPFFKDTIVGAIDIGKKLGVDIIPMAPKRWGCDYQVPLIEEAIKKGVAGIAIGPIDDQRVKNAIKKAVSKGIKVVAFDNNITDCGVSGFIGTDNFFAGKSLGESAIKCLNGKGNIVISTTSHKVENMALRINGIKEAIEKYSEIKLVGMESDHQLIANRIEYIQDLLKKRNDVDCIIYLDFQGAETMENLTNNYEVNAKIIGFDKTDEAMRMLKAGKLSSIVVQRPKIWGELAIKRLNDLTLGKNIPEFEDAGTFEINKRSISMYH